MSKLASLRRRALVTALAHDNLNSNSRCRKAVEGFHANAALIADNKKWLVLVMVFDGEPDLTQRGQCVLDLDDLFRNA
jgi:hypothetical protein